MKNNSFIKRVYEQPEKTDGFRILIDRLWPRGLSKEKAKVDLWLKEIAPSTKLRKWFNHEPEKWKAFEKNTKRNKKEPRTIGAAAFKDERRENYIGIWSQRRAIQ
jgi:uncharacterized protein YeaO (DUF488 family)